MNEIERWVSLEDIAHHLDVSKDTIRAWIKKKPSHTIKLEGNTNSEYLRLMHGLKVARAPMLINKMKTEE